VKQLGIDTKPLVAGIGVSGFIVGFTLKEVRSITIDHQVSSDPSHLLLVDMLTKYHHSVHLS
jgi:hypothetical protein